MKLQTSLVPICLEDIEVKPLFDEIEMVRAKMKLGLKQFAERYPMLTELRGLLQAHLRT